MKLTAHTKNILFAALSAVAVINPASDVWKCNIKSLVFDATSGSEVPKIQYNLYHTLLGYDAPYMK